MILVFSYGSNSTAQLRARVRNPSLRSFPARADGLVRVFCKSVESWGSGPDRLSGVASMAPSSYRGAVTHGAAVELTDEEMVRLEAFEKTYRKEVIDILTWPDGNLEGPGVLKEAVVFIAGLERDGIGGEGQPYTLGISSLPSEQYLCAIHGMLREHWNIDGKSIEIRRYARDGSTPLVKEWIKPRTRALTLRAFCVEVNLNKEKPWVMPRTIHKVINKLSRLPNVDVDAHASQLTEHFPHLEQMFKEDTLQAMRGLLH